MLLEQLPSELIVRVLCEFEGPTIACTRLVCKRLDELISESVALQYKMQLSIHGYEDPTFTAEADSQSPSSAERLSSLRNHVYAWRTLDHEYHLLDLPIGAFWQVDRGYYVLMTTGKLAVYKLPARGEHSATKVAENGVGFMPESISIDVEMDLLVLTQRPGPDGEPIINLRTLSTNTPHPRAKQPSLRIPYTLGPQFEPTIKIMGDTLGVLYDEDPHWDLPAYLTIWDWTTGQMHSRVPMNTRSPSFCFTSPSTVIVPETDNDHKSIAVYNFKRPHHALYLRSYALPDTQSHNSPSHRITLQSDRTRTSFPSKSFPSALPFRTQASNNLVLIRWETHRAVIDPTNPTLHDVEPIAHNIFVPSSLFNDDQPPVQITVPSIPWHLWGPSHARFLQPETRSERSDGLVGARYVAFDQPKAMTVLDFNGPVHLPFTPQPQFRNDEAGHVYRRTIKVEGDKDRVSIDGLFDGPIDTEQARYSKTSRSMAHLQWSWMNPSGVLVDDSHIVRVHVDRSGGKNTYDEKLAVLTF